MPAMSTMKRPASKAMKGLKRPASSTSAEGSLNATIDKMNKVGKLRGDEEQGEEDDEQEAEEENNDHRDKSKGQKYQKMKS